MNEQVTKLQELRSAILRDSEFAAWLKINWYALYDDIQNASNLYPYFYDTIEDEYDKYLKTLEPTISRNIKEFRSHVYNSITDLIERMQLNDGYDSEKDDFVLSINGKSLVIPNNADSYESVEYFLNDLLKVFDGE